MRAFHFGRMLEDHSAFHQAATKLGCRAETKPAKRVLSKTRWDQQPPAVLEPVHSTRLLNVLPTSCTNISWGVKATPHCSPILVQLPRPSPFCTLGKEGDGNNKQRCPQERPLLFHGTFQSGVVRGSLALSLSPLSQSLPRAFPHREACLSWILRSFWMLQSNNA